MISIIDYGMGNLGSVENMLTTNGTQAEITEAPEKISQATHLILPGVGSFDSAMKNLNDRKLIQPILDAVANGAHLLGICLGAQLLLERSEEGKLAGLGLIKGYCKQFDAAAIAPLKVPHMGWSDVKFNNGHVLAAGFDHPRFYFVHSFFFKCDRPEDVFGTAQHGEEFACAIGSGKIFGVQFHPEKSHRFGAQLLNNFGSL